MIYKIYYNPDRADLIFAAAVIINKLWGEKGIVIPGKIENFLDEKSTLDDGYWDEDDEEHNVQKNKNKIYLLDIGPNDSQEADIIRIFLERHKQEVVFWSDSHNWPDGVLKYLNEDIDCIRLNRNESVLEMLEKFGYESPRLWKKTADSMLDVQKLTKDYAALRYIEAFAASCIMSKNSGQDEMFKTFIQMINELLYGAVNNEITNLADFFYVIKEKTEKAKKMFSENFPIFRTAKKIGRPIGFLNLGEFRNDVNLGELLEHGIKKFPWLCIITYSIKGLQFSCASSTVFPVEYYINDKDIISLIKESATVYKLLNAEVIIHKDPDS